MLKFTVVVILETLGLLALAPKKALAQSQNAHDLLVVDPADHAVYVARAGQALDIGSVVGRWLPDGTFDRMNGPFALVPVQKDLTPLLYAGRMTLVADRQTLYQREASGAWVGTPSHRLPGDPLGCGSDAKGRCVLFTAVRDGNGDQDLLVISATGAQIRYPTLGGYRGAEGVETKIDFNSIVFTMIYHSEYVWSPDRQQLLVTNTNFGGTDKPQMSYNVFTMAGQETRIVSNSAALSQYSLQNLLKLGDGVYMVLTDFLSVSGDGVKPVIPQIFAVEAPFSKTPHAVQILNNKDYSSGMLLGVAHEGEYIYLRRGFGRAGELAAFHAKSKDLVDIGPCPSDAVHPVVPIDSQKGSRIYWLACGQQIYGLHDGRVVQSYTAAGQVTAGTALPAAAGAGDGDEVVVTEAGGGLERFAPDGSHQRIAADGAGSILRPALKASWLTATGQLCGVTADAPGVIGCERGRSWQPGSYTMPPPYAVWHTPDAEWALSVVGSDTLVHRRAAAAPESGWQRIQAFASVAPPSFDKRSARFIPQGPTQVAVQDAAGQYWRWDGRGFTPSYQHSFVPSVMQPVIGEDGYLYDACPVQAGATTVLVCAFTPDGVSHSLEGQFGVTVNARLAPLKRGVLAQESPDPVVLRGARSIALSKLQGEFARGKDAFGSSQGPALGDGSVLLINPKGDKIYRYDGHGVTLFKTVAIDEDDGISDKVRSDGQIWLGSDGVWRLSSQADGRGFIYANDPLQLTAALGAVKTGSQILAAVSFQHQTWLATPHGLWTCSTDRGTPLSAEASALPVTKGCVQRSALPYVTKLKSTDTSLVVLQGNRVLELTPGADASGQDDRIEALSSMDTPEPAGALGHSVSDGVDVVSFVEGEHVVLRSGKPAVRLAWPLPVGVTSSQVHATGERWLCSDAGLFWLDPGQAWQAVYGGEACVGMAAAGGQVLALSQTGARLCQQGACGEAVALPKPYLDDTTVGTLDAGAAASAAGFGLVMGRYLFRFSPSGFVDITPTYAKGSAVLTTASDLNNGFVSLRVGGVLAPTGDSSVAPAWRHLRLQ